MTDDIWQYYMRDLSRAAEFMTDRVYQLASEIAEWKAVAERFYNCDPDDRQGWLYACIAFEDITNKRNEKEVDNDR